MRRLQLLLILFISAISFAQNTGSIKGKLTDKEYNNEPLPFANVLIKGTSVGTTSDMDGLYMFEDLEVGSYTIVFSFVGYETQEIKVNVEADKVTILDVTMGASAATLETVVLGDVSRKKESEIAILLEQKKAATTQTKIGAVELSKKGVGDVSTGLTKAAGISKESDKLYVRGLGDRYNTAYLNGLPIPSLNPKLKLLDLGIFPTKIVENLGIFKAYSSHLYGDFAGASVDINTKDSPGKKLLEIGFGSGVNTTAISNDFFLLDGGKYDFYGLDDGSRFPTPLLNIPNYTYNSNDVEYYPFKTGFNPEQRLDGPNVNANILAGHSFNTSDSSKLDLLLSASFSNGHESTINGFETVYNSQGELDQGSYLFNYDRYRYKTNTTVLGSASFKWNSNNTITSTTLFVNDTEDELREFTGVSGENTELNTYVRRGTFQQNNLFTQQLTGNHKFEDGKYEINYGGAYNKALGYVPDRRQLFFSERQDGSIVLGNFRNTNDSDNQRFYQELNEDDFSTNISFDINFSKDEDDVFKNKLTLGINTRAKERDFEAKQINYIFDANNTVVELNNPDAFLNEQNLLNDVYNVIEVTRPQNAYEADLNTLASFALFKWQVSENVLVNTGLRVEDFEQNVFYKDPVTSDASTGTIDEFFVLPSLDIKYTLNEKTNLRIAASKTITLPLFTEIAPFLDEDVNEFTIGNPDLKNSDNYNFDIKYEFFPRNGEVFSVTAFGKYLDQPIEKIRIASANNNNSFVNSDNAKIFGGEIEYRQQLNNIFTNEDDESALSNLSLGLNATVMYTKVVIDPTVTVLNAAIAPTNLERKLQGASPYIFNADINFSKEFGKHNISTTLDFNYFGDRIYSAGGNGVGDIFEKGFGTLNFNFKDTFNEHWEIGLSAKNLLNPTIDRYQDQEDINQELTVSSYQIGSNISLGFTYKF
ncbi:TonB-dependent receptor [uncultured Winogradskyella sp.]|uniref:TonB-dependent receptor n=1 Tax=uncultured Winogradskyella sp. TaxID=395353 RepID=UPI0026399480|nr:TonB-dependent receptor [uncultured Winogradskyella sp.]